jgi:hypothetical protein
MEYTQQQKQEFREEFARRRKRQLLLAVPMIALFAVNIFFKTGGRGGALHRFLSSDWPLWILIAFIAFALVFSLRNWRCPACHSYLGRDASPRFCPKCGVRFAEEHT